VLKLWPAFSTRERKSSASGSCDVSSFWRWARFWRRKNSGSHAASRPAATETTTESPTRNVTATAAIPMALEMAKNRGSVICGNAWSRCRCST
jgi:hypothetical protein